MSRLRVGDVRRSPVGDVIILMAGPNVGYVRFDGDNQALLPTPTSRADIEGWPLVMPPDRRQSPRGVATLLHWKGSGPTAQRRIMYEDTQAFETVDAHVIEHWPSIDQGS